MNTFYELIKGDIQSTICFEIINFKVRFKQYALINEENKFLAAFTTKDAAESMQNNKLYKNSNLFELAMPDSIIVAAIDNRIFNSANDVINFINGGYIETAEYKVAKLEKELSDDDVNTDLLTLNEYKQYKQDMNKKALASYLEANPITWTDGKLYGVTQEDQLEMQTDLAAYNLKHAAGQTDWKLEWHDKSKSCREFTLEEFYGLMNAIVDFVYPLRRKQEEYKEMIFSCETREDLDAIVISYGPEPDVPVVEPSDKEIVDDTTEIIEA